MKGIIFNAVEDAVTTLYSEDTWDDLLDAAGIEGTYTSLGNYDDEDLHALVLAGCELTGMEAEDLVRTLGRYAFPHLSSRYPELLGDASTTHTFLRRVNDIIHPEVLKLHPDAKPPEFKFEQRSDDVLRVTYHSTRKLGVLAEGLMIGAGDHFSETVTVEVVEGAGTEVTVFDVHSMANELATTDRTADAVG